MAAIGHMRYVHFRTSDEVHLNQDLLQLGFGEDGQIAMTAEVCDRPGFILPTSEQGLATGEGKLTESITAWGLAS